MPTRSEVEQVARKLRRAGERVSVRNVRRVLPKGGSYSTIGPLLAQWKVDADYRPGKLPAEVPAALAGALNALAAQVWAAAKVEAEKVVEIERKRLDLLERVHEREAVAAWAEVDRLNEVVADLTRQVGRLRSELLPPAALSPPPMTEAEAAEHERWRGFIGSLPGNWLDRARGQAPTGSVPEAEEMETLLHPLEAQWAAERDGVARAETSEERPSARRFWDKVMREAAAVIGKSKDRALAPPEILDRLSPATRAAATAYQLLDATLLKKKMMERVRRGKFFRLQQDGRFGLLAGPTRRRPAGSGSTHS